MSSNSARSCRSGGKQRLLEPANRIAADIRTALQAFARSDARLREIAAVAARRRAAVQRLEMRCAQESVANGDTVRAQAFDQIVGANGAVSVHGVRTASTFAPWPRRPPRPRRSGRALCRTLLRSVRLRRRVETSSCAPHLCRESARQICCAAARPLVRARGFLRGSSMLPRQFAAPQRQAKISSTFGRVVRIAPDRIVVVQLLARLDRADRLDEHALVLDGALAVGIAGVIDESRLVAVAARHR